MKSFLKKNIESIKIISFCFIVSLIILSLTSKCSFFYPFNDWVDANAFFTVGKAMFNNVVPYRDIFEQKGIFLYFIYGLGYLISNTSFLGVFVFELLFFTTSMYYCFKIVNLFLPKIYAYTIIPLYATFICTSLSFVHGGGAEEFCLPFMAITLYYFLDHFKNGEITYKRLFIAGFLAGLVLLTKYTLLGFWFGFMAIIFFDLFFSKKYKKSFLACVWFLIGMIIPFIIAAIYLLINNALDDFINVYFILNMTAYNDGTSVHIIRRLYRIYRKFASMIYHRGVFAIALVGLAPILSLKFDIKWKGRIAVVGIYLLTILGVFWGLRFYKYYLFPMLIFGIISMTAIFMLLHKFVKLQDKKIILFSVTIATCLAWCFANYKEMRFMDKKEMFQYRYAEIVNQSPHPTLVNMDALDCGLYTTSGIIPSTYFFEKQNFDYERFPDNLDSFARYIEERETEFILYSTTLELDELDEREPKLFENYDLIKKDKYNNEHNWRYAYLFKRKDNKNE